MTLLTLDDQLSYSLRRQYIDDFLRGQFETIPAGQVLFDVGGTKSLPKGHFAISEYRLRVLTFNISDYRGVDVLADAASMPARSDSADVVLCSEVLEHVADPRLVLAEVFRMLKPGGQLIAGVPFLYRLHADPVDYGRYTNWYWQENLEKLGFTDIQIVKQGLFWSVWVDMLRDWFRHLVIEGSAMPRFTNYVAPRLMRWLRRRARTADQVKGRSEHNFFGRYTTGFEILAFKP